MSKHKKHEPESQDVFKEIPEAKKDGGVLILSLRKGDVIMKDGRVLKYKQTLKFTPKEADWLVLSFKDEMIKVSV